MVGSWNWFIIHDAFTRVDSPAVPQHRTATLSRGLTCRLQVAYTYYSYRFQARQKNKGWRLDYFLASSSLVPRAHDSYCLPSFEGSDHVPLGLILRDQ